MALKTSLFEYAKAGILWSFIQVWVNKLFTLVLWIVLARLLEPQDFGIAAAASLILLLIPEVADLGFGRAILQRPDLKDQDINLPFYVALFLTICVTLAIILNVELVAQWLKSPEAALYISFIAGTLILAVVNRFQRAVYQRHMRFKDLAIRTFYANLIGGGLAITAAFLGAKYWSFLVQVYATELVFGVSLWLAPMWVPKRHLAWDSFREMFRFGLPLAFNKIVTFSGRRVIDVIIISTYGLATYGVYSVGARLFQVFTQLFQNALGDVSISALSRISDDTERMVAVYKQTLQLIGVGVLPAFILCASIAPEIVDVLFGSKWLMSGPIAQALLVMGGLNCLYFISTPFNAARGNSFYTFLASGLRLIITVLAMVLLPSTSIYELTIIFSLAFLSGVPLAFYFVARDLNLNQGFAYKIAAPSILICTICFLAVHATRPFLEGFITLHSFVQGAVLGLIFGLLYLALTAALTPKALAAILKKLRKKKSG